MHKQYKPDEIQNHSMKQFKPNPKQFKQSQVAPTSPAQSMPLRKTSPDFQEAKAGVRAQARPEREGEWKKGGRQRVLHLNSSIECILHRFSAPNELLSLLVQKKYQIRTLEGVQPLAQYSVQSF